MDGVRKYRKQGSLQEYHELVRDKVHNCLKHGDTESLKKYQVYLDMRGNRNNRHKTKIYYVG